MARFKDYSYEQMTMLPVSFDRQILPGSFEYNLTYLIEECLDPSIFHHRYKNDDGGRPAYDPAILLKVVLLAYSKGITSSRKIEQLCRDNILFIAISANSQPHFTTIADFISSSHQEIEKLFLQVLMVCDQEGLIGKDMFAIDGCKLPSNASKEWSGTQADLKKKKLKMEKAVRRMLSKHREVDKHGLDETIVERQKQQCRKLAKTAKKIQAFLDSHDDRKGVSGRTVQSNITDNDSAKMKTSHGVIQGYTGVATVDAKHQVIVSAEAHGQGQEHNLLKPSLESASANLKLNKQERRQIKITADSGYHNLSALQYLDQEKLDGYIADVGFRSRDPRFKDYERHKPVTRLKPKERFTSNEFKVDLKHKTCICPAGNAMWLQCEETKIGNSLFMKFQGYENDCRHCHLRKRCLRSEQQKSPRQFAVKLGNTKKHQQTSLIEKMKQKIDSAMGRHIYSQRLGTVEPVFGNITSSIGFKRFSLRGKQKVNGQWQLISMIHNILKIHRYAWNGS
jgi:transposase